MIARRPSAGELDQRITLQRRTDTDQAGEAIGDWMNVVTVWAKSEPLRGQKYFAAGQMQTPVDVKFVIRSREGVDTTMRVIWQGLPHDIVSVIDVEGAHEWLELMCIEGVRDGR